MIQPFVVIFGGTFTPKQVIEIKKHCTPTLLRAQDIQKLPHIVRQKRPQVFVTIGGADSDYKPLFDAPLNIRARWMHYATSADFLAKCDLLVNVFVNSIVVSPIEQAPPLISVFTTSYNSGKFIQRPLHSLLAQSYTNWEWVIYDDSDGDANWQALRKVREHDRARIRIYRGDGNSGVIGNVKQIASSLCRGEFLVELDHDDELAPDACVNLIAAARKHPDAGFFYSDYCFIHEDGTNDEHPDGFALGFGGYRRMWNETFQKWTNISRTVPITHITIRYLVGCPNHYRAWRATVFRAIGGWSPHFHVADDYEILVRTFLNTPMVRIARKGYTQYVNDNYNNFTFIRNAEIQKLWRSLSRAYNDRLHARMVELSGEDPFFDNWEDYAQVPPYHSTPEHVEKFNAVYDPRDQDAAQPLVFAVFVYEQSIDNGAGTAIQKIVEAMARQTYGNTELMIVSSDCAAIVEPWMDRLAADATHGEFVRRNVCYWNFVKPLHHAATPYYMCVNHALKRINTAQHTLMLYGDLLPDDFIARAMRTLLAREDVHGVVLDDSPHFLFRCLLHIECGYLAQGERDVRAVLERSPDTVFVSYDEIGEEKESDDEKG